MAFAAACVPQLTMPKSRDAGLTPTAPATPCPVRPRPVALVPHTAVPVTTRAALVFALMVEVGWKRAVAPAAPPGAMARGEGAPVQTTAKSAFSGATNVTAAAE